MLARHFLQLEIILAFYPYAGNYHLSTISSVFLLTQRPVPPRIARGERYISIRLGRLIYVCQLCFQTIELLFGLQNLFSQSLCAYSCILHPSQCYRRMDVDNEKERADCLYQTLLQISLPKFFENTWRAWRRQCSYKPLRNIVLCRRSP